MHEQAFATFVRLSQITLSTDGRTDRILIARPRLHSMQRGKNSMTTSMHLKKLLKINEKMKILHTERVTKENVLLRIRLDLQIKSEIL